MIHAYLIASPIFAALCVGVGLYLITAKNSDK